MPSDCLVRSYQQQFITRAVLSSRVLLLLRVRPWPNSLALHLRDLQRQSNIGQHFHQLGFHPLCQLDRQHTPDLLAQRLDMDAIRWNQRCGK